MKKIFIMSFFALLFIQACKKDQQLIDNKKPEERVAEAMEKYSQELVNSPNGWVATIKTNVIEGTYSFYMNFDKASRVTMWADYEVEAAESTYRLKYVMAPSIIFDTYSTLHYLQDPNPDEFNGEYGQGFGSDFEFEFREEVGDTIKLLGKKRMAELKLVRATPADKAFYTGGGLLDFKEFLADNLNLYILDEKDNTKKIPLSIDTDPTKRSVSLTIKEGDQFTAISQPFAFTSTGLSNTPLVFGSNTFTHFTWDPVGKKLFWVTTAGKKVEVLVSGVPLFPLRDLIGVKYSSITLPNETSYPGWGTDFIARRALGQQRVNANIVVGGVPINLGAMRFTFNTTTKVMTLLINTPYGNSSLNLTYPYSFTKSDAGIYKFNIFNGFDGNSTFVYNQASRPLNPLLVERFNVDTFKLDYFVHPTTGAVLGQFISIEHPDFTFAGALQ